MEILFKNRHVRNKELAKEIYRFYYFQRKVLLVCYILLAINFIGTLVGVIFFNYDFILMLILVPLFFAFQIFRYFYQVNIMIRRDNETHGKEIEVETIVTDSFVQLTSSNGGVNKVEYDKIKSVVQTKNLILLHSKANLIYIFDKRTFDVGTIEEFISFLKTKGIIVR